MNVRANIFGVGVVPWKIKPCTTQSYGVTDTMSMQSDLDCRKKNGAGMQKEAETESTWHQEKEELRSFTLLECSQ